jgi:hypothetical protein
VSTSDHPTQDNAGDEWVLVRQCPAVEALRLDPSLTDVRAVSEEERERLQAAEGVLDRFGDTWAYIHSLRLAEAFFGYVDQFWTSFARAHGIPNPADLDRIRWGLEEFATELVSWLEGAGSSGEAQVASVAATVLSSAPVRACMEIVGAEEVTVVPDVHLPQHRLGARLGGAAHVDSPLYDASAVVRAAVGAAHLVAEAELLESERALFGAATTLMSVMTDVLYGSPALARAPFEPWRGGPLQLQDIGVQKIAPVLLALDRARVSRETRARAASRTNSPQGDTSETGAPVPEEEDEQAEPKLELADEIEATDDALDADAGPQTGVAGSEERDDHAAVDIHGLVDEAQAMPLALERRWRDALVEGMDDAVTDLRSRIQSLATEISRRAMEESTAATRAGLEVRLPALPLSTMDANRLEADPTGDAASVQHGIATVHVVEALVAAIGLFERPDALQIQMPEGVSKSWWSLDVFTRVRAAAELARRVLAESEQDADKRRASMHTRAARAWAVGLPEAAAAYIVAALDEQSEISGDRACAFSTLRTLAARIADGQPVSMDALVPVVVFWLTELQARPNPAYTPDRSSGTTEDPGDVAQ